MLRRLAAVPLFALYFVGSLTLIVPLIYWILTGKDWLLLLLKVVDYGDKPKVEENEELDEELGGNDCLCQQNAKGRRVMGWCTKHKTDWI